MLRFLLLFSLLACTGPLAAADLYRAEVPGADPSPAGRAQATREALAQVLTRLLPQDDQARRAAAALGPQAGELLASYEYRTGADGTQTFRARFDASAVHQRLAQAGLPAWGEPRPRVLLWVGYDGGDGVSLIGADSPLAADLEQAGQRYGLPLELPLLAAGEEAQLGPAAVVRLEWEDLAAASVPYAPDAYAVLLVSAGQERLRGRVNLARPDGETTAAQVEADTLAALFDAAARHLAGALAAYYLGQDATTATAPAGAASPEVPAQAAPAATPAAVERPIASPAPQAALASPAPAASPAREAAAPAPTAPGGAGSAAVPASVTAPHVAPAPAPLAPVHADGVLVELAGLGSGAAYQRARAQLAALGGVTALVPLAAQGDTVVLELRYPAGALALRRALELDGAFALEPAQDPASALRLRYRGG